jgi:hypothetical protein
MALGVEGMRAAKVVRKAIFLTLGTVIFIFCLTLVYLSMRAVMDVGGACASGGAYEIRQQCPKGVGWVMPVGIFGMFFAGIFTFLGVFPDGGPRPYVFAWSALFLALGWNFLDYGFDSPGGGAEVGWIVCGVVFVIMGGAPLLFLLSPRAARWALWGPDSQRADDYLHPYKPPPVRAPKRPADMATETPAEAPVATGVHTSTPYARPAPTVAAPVVPDPAPTAPTLAPAKPAPTKDVVERLATLADLRERGLLDDEEYERAKTAVLDEEGSS